MISQQRHFPQDGTGATSGDLLILVELISAENCHSAVCQKIKPVSGVSLSNEVLTQLKVTFIESLFNLRKNDWRQL